MFFFFNFNSLQSIHSLTDRTADPHAQRLRPQEGRRSAAGYQPFFHVGQQLFHVIVVGIAAQSAVPRHAVQHTVARSRHHGHRSGPQEFLPVQQHHVLVGQPHAIHDDQGGAPRSGNRP